MRYENVVIMGLAYLDAPDRMTSAELEDMLAPAMERFHAPAGLLESLTGIQARHFWEEGTQPSEAATRAARHLLDNIDFDPKQIGVLVNTSVCKDYIEPSVASLVHGNLKLGEHAMNFDVGNACLGFMNGMQIVANMIESRQIDYGLVVAGEDSRHAIMSTVQRMLDPECSMKTFRGEFPTMTLGSGAAAMLLTRGDLFPDGHQVKRALSMAATEHNRLCLGHPNQMVTQSKELLFAGLELSVKMGKKMLEDWGKEPNMMDEYVLHQVSETHTNSLIEAICLNPDRLHRIYPEFGNVGPLGIPVTLAKSAELGRIKSGDHVGLYGIGSGINSMAMEIVW